MILEVGTSFSSIKNDSNIDFQFNELLSLSYNSHGVSYILMIKTLGNEFILVIIDSYSKFIDDYCTQAANISITVELSRRSLVNFVITDLTV